MDTYALVTDRIIAELAQGRIPWRKPWAARCGAISRATGKPYSLLNQLLLGGQSGEYVTFRQAAAEGSYVKKGEKGHTVVFWKWLKVTDEDTGEEKEIPYLKHYTVFHINQCEGLTPKYTASAEAVTNPAEADERAEKIITDYVTRSGVKLIRRESNEAYYSPARDEIVIPDITQFTETPEYYSTAFHETVHSTGSASRLCRINTTAAFGSDDYSQEELVAELGASYLLNHCGLESPSSFRNNAAYIQAWLKELKNDKRLIVVAAGKAEKAVRYILADEEGADENV